MLIDGYDRKIDYLRVSVTERCNFRCQYCMPEKPFSWVPKENLLNFEELFMFIKVAIDEGVTKIRITGGEPTLRADLDTFIAMISKYKSDIDLAMTSNGFLLHEYAKKLKDAGLKRINISLDSLKKDVASKIANKDVLDGVLRGIDKSLEVGLKVKINVVPMRGVNENELVDLLEYAKKRGMGIRFIEFMENTHASEVTQRIDNKEILEIISKRYDFEDVGFDGSSPSHYYRLEDGYEFGVIEPHEDDFCKNCNRIRLTAEGNLIPCLYFDEALSIKDAIKAHDFEKATQILKEVIANKPEKNRWDDESEVSTRAFYETGG